MSVYLSLLNKGCRLIREKKLPTDRRKDLQQNWDSYFIEESFSNNDILFKYEEDSSECLLYKDSANLSIYDILYKSKGKISRFPKSDFFTNMVRMRKICYYSIYIHHHYFECEMDEHRILNQCYYLCAHSFVDIENIAPEFIESIFKEEINRYMNKVISDQELKPTNNKAKMFTNASPQTISKMTGDYRCEKIAQWLKEYMTEFQLKYYRTPTLSEIQFMLQKRFKESEEKIFKVFVKKDGVKLVTLYKWLDAAGIDKKSLTRKKKSLILYYE